METENSDWVNGSAVRLDGVSEQVRIESSSSLNTVHADLTLSMWVRFDQTTGTNYESIASVGSWTDQRLNIYPVDGRLQVSAATLGRPSVLVSSPLPFLQNADGQFHHIVIAKNADQSQLALYVDGVLVSENQSVTGSVDFRGWELAFGGNSRGQHLLPMTLDSALFYTRGLTPAEVSQLYRAGTR